VGREDLLGFLADERWPSPRPAEAHVIWLYSGNSWRGADAARLAVVPMRAGVEWRCAARRVGLVGGARRCRRLACAQVDNAASRRLYASAGLRR
jgi:hypothetical protein